MANRFSRLAETPARLGSVTRGARSSQRQSHCLVFADALVGMVLLTNIGTWLSQHRYTNCNPPKYPARLASMESVIRIRSCQEEGCVLPGIRWPLMFSKFLYLASLISYYTFYLMSRFHLSVHNASSISPCFLARSPLALLSAVRWVIRSAASLSSGAPSWAFFPFTLVCRTPICSGPQFSAW